MSEFALGVGDATGKALLINFPEPAEVAGPVVAQAISRGGNAHLASVSGELFQTQKYAGSQNRRAGFRRCQEDLISARFFSFPIDCERPHFHNVSVELRHKLYLLAIFVVICFAIWLSMRSV